MRKNTEESINLMQLKFFLVVAEFQKISKAADVLFRTQSAVTRAISDLENTLKVTLFERHYNGVLLTEIGRYIFQLASNALKELQDIPQLVQQHQMLHQPIIEPYYLYNTRRLEIFSTLYLTKGMKNTASLLNITQPAVSSAIKILEESLEVKLFIRTPNGIMSTTICDIIQKNINRCLNIIQNIPHYTADFIGNVQGSVKIGALPLIRTYILPKAIAKLTPQFKNIHFLTFENSYESLVSQLRAGDIDFIIGALRPMQQSSDLDHHILFEENTCMVVRQKHPLLKCTIKSEDLLAAQWILPRSNAPARELFEENFNALKLPSPKPTVETGDLALTRGLLLESNMIAIVSAQQMKYELDQGLIKILPFELKYTKRQIGIISRKNCIHSNASQILINSLIETCNVAPTISEL